MMRGRKIWQQHAAYGAYRARLAALPRRIGAIVFDFDGVFTDNRAYVLQDGSEAVACNRSDGLAIKRLRKLELPALVLSAEANPVVTARCDKLKLPCIQGFDSKLPSLQRWLGEQGVDPGDAVYVGNDLNDVPCMRAVGCGIAPSDARPRVRRCADIVLASAGGEYAVREVVELVLERLGRFDVLDAVAQGTAD